MAKKSKRSVSSKKSTESVKAEEAVKEQASVTDNTDEAEAKSTDDVKAETVTSDDAKAEATTDEPDEVEAVEVVEIEEPATDDSKTSTGIKEKKSLSDKLTDLNPAALIAEAVGTFVLAAAFIQLASNTNYGTIGIALVLSIITIVFGAVSGSHFNPAVSIAQWINRKINGVKAVAYIVAQVLGAILAFFVLTGLQNANFDLSAQVKSTMTERGYDESTIKSQYNMSYDEFIKQNGGEEAVAKQLGIKTKPELYKVSSLTTDKEWAALLSEIVGAFVFGLGAAYAVAKRKECKVAAGLVMGFAFLAGLVIAGSTAILNPAIAGAVSAFNANKAIAIVWAIVVYVLGPIIGVTLGTALYNLITKRDDVNAKALED